jgi:hypothetical protein
VRGRLRAQRLGIILLIILIAVVNVSIFATYVINLGTQVREEQSVAQLLASGAEASLEVDINDDGSLTVGSDSLVDDDLFIAMWPNHFSVVDETLEPVFPKPTLFFEPTGLVTEDDAFEAFEFVAVQGEDEPFSLGNGLLAQGTPLRAATGAPGAIIAVADTTAADDAHQRTVLGVLAMSAALVLAGAFAAWLVAGRTMRPAERLLADKAHELRTPITAFRATADAVTRLRRVAELAAPTQDEVADECILSTAYAGSSRGYDVVVVGDDVATATTNQEMALTVANGTVANVLLTDDVIGYMENDFSTGEPGAVKGVGRLDGRKDH